MDVRCVWEEAVAWVCFMLVLSVMSREAAGDEQKPPRPPLQYLLFLSPLLSFQVILSCFSQCNILVLIKANKGKHSVMGEERRIFWFPGEPDSSLFTSSYYKSRGSFNAWMAMLCVNVSLSWLQRSSRRTALLLLRAMVPNSMLQWSTSIACAVIQYQFGPLTEFVIHQSNCRIEMVLYCKWHLSEHNWRPIPFWQCNSHPNCLIGIQLSHKRLCWNSIVIPQALNTAAHISSSFSVTFYLHHLRVFLCNIAPWGELKMRTVLGC